MSSYVPAEQLSRRLGHAWSGPAALAAVQHRGRRDRRRPRAAAARVPRGAGAAVGLGPSRACCSRHIDGGAAVEHAAPGRRLHAAVRRASASAPPGCVERTDVPLRRLWAVLLVLPLGIPDFVVGFGWVSIAPGLHGYLAAVMIMTLSLYPLVYLPVAAAMANLDAGLEEAARSLGLSPWARVPAGHAAPGLAGGARRLPAGDARRCSPSTARLRSSSSRRSPCRSSPSSSSASTPPPPARSRSCSSRSASPCSPASSRSGGRGRAFRTGPGAKRDALARARSAAGASPALLAVLALCGLALGVPAGLARLLDRCTAAPRRCRQTSILSALGHTVALQRGRRGALDAARGARLHARPAPPQPPDGPDRAALLPADGAARPGRRARPRRVLGPLRLLALPELARADRRLRDPVPAARGRRRALGDGAGLAALRGARPLAGPPPGGGLRRASRCR